MRRHKSEEHLNHEAWAIPYADLMTLLLAFFVVMYAVSVVNEGKYRVMSESLIQAFNGSSSTVVPVPAPTPELTKSANARIAPVSSTRPANSHIKLPMPARAQAAAGLSSQVDGARRSLDQIEDQVRRALQPLIDRKLVVVRHKPDWLEVEIRTDILFPSGVAQLSTSADTVLHSLADILAPFPNPLRVEGFTDNVPISTPQYPSNWELSAARAASVARLFASSGVTPARLGIIGWGEVRPLTDNATAEGRNQNRRVLVVVMNEQPGAPREQNDAAHVRDIADAATPPSATDDLPTVSVRAPTPPASGQPELPSVPIIVAADAVPVEPTAPAVAKPSRSSARPVSPDR